LESGNLKGPSLLLLESPALFSLSIYTYQSFHAHLACLPWRRRKHVYPKCC
jgi:hypothetical protein